MQFRLTFTSIIMAIRRCSNTMLVFCPVLAPGIVQLLIVLFT